MKTLTAIFVACFATSAAADVKFCFKAYGDYDDSGAPMRNGVTEDYWVDGALTRELRGAKYEIRSGSSTGAVVASGYLGDGLGAGDTGIGCSAVIALANVNRTYFYRVDSDISVNENFIIGRRVDLNQTCYRSTTYAHTGGNGTFTLTLAGNSVECANVFRSVNAAALSLYRHRAGNSNVTFDVNVGATCDNSTYGTTPCLSSFGANRKFVISHEMGHAVSYARDSEVPYGDCTFEDNPKCELGTNGDHSMASLEFAKCAVREAYAHFYAADTYNSHSSEECAFSYYKSYFPADPNLAQPVVDCRGVATDQSAIKAGGTPTWSLFPTMTMETINPPNFSSPGCTRPLANRAVEVDYLRVFWSMHTDGSNSADFTPMMDWMVNAFNFGQSNAYNELVSSANSTGGNVDLQWDYWRIYHGVDHP